MNKLVILHGWGGDGETLQPLSKALAHHTQQNATDIFLGEYISLDDDVRMSDLVSGLNAAWQDKKLDDHDKVNVLAYSTGALIIRDWLHQFYTVQKKNYPIENLIMIAPANFGSPLAHKGRSFICRVTKGFNAEKTFETGKYILEALEMGSPYGWQLAERDRFKKHPFTPKEVRTTVIVGNKGHGGIKSIANALGSDGTVYTCTASMRSAKLVLDYSDIKKGIQSRFIETKGDTAFLTLDDYNHNTIAHKKNNSVNGENIDAIVEALSIESEEAFRKWIRNCNTKTNRLLKAQKTCDNLQKQGFQNIVFRVNDHEGNSISDYVIEFFTDEDAGDDDFFCEVFNTEVIAKVHVNKLNPSYRSFIVNCHQLEKLFEEYKKPLRIRISAYPDIDDEKNHVGYKSMATDEHSPFVIEPSQFNRYFKPNRTLFIDVILQRMRKPSVLRIHRLADLNEDD